MVTAIFNLLHENTNENQPYKYVCIKNQPYKFDCLYKNDLYDLEPPIYKRTHIKNQIEQFMNYLCLTLAINSLFQYFMLLINLL